MLYRTARARCEAKYSAMGADALRQALLSFKLDVTLGRVGSLGKSREGVVAILVEAELELQARAPYASRAV